MLQLLNKKINILSLNTLAGGSFTSGINGSTPLDADLFNTANWNNVFYENIFIQPNTIDTFTFRKKCIVEIDFSFSAKHSGGGVPNYELFLMLISSSIRKNVYRFPLFILNTEQLQQPYIGGTLPNFISPNIFTADVGDSLYLCNSVPDGLPSPDITITDLITEGGQLHTSFNFNLIQEL